MLLKWFLATLMVLFLSIHHALAAEIRVIAIKDADFGGQTEIHIELNGRITRGDHQKFVKLIDRPDLSKAKPELQNQQHYFVLHLYSPQGGSFDEALNIIEAMLIGSVGTVLDENAECFSACALIFMAGNYLYRSNFDISRRMHPTASLGFHAPYIAARTSVGYNKAIRQIARVLKLFDRPMKSDLAGPMMRQSLQAQILAKGPEEKLSIDTVDKAGRWGIDLFDFKAPRKLKSAHYWNACLNALNWKRDIDHFSTFGFTMDDDRQGFVSLKKPTGSGSGETPRMRVQVLLPHDPYLMVPHGCNFLRDPDPLSYSPLDVLTWRDTASTNFDFIEPAPLWSVFPGNWKLSQLVK